MSRGRMRASATTIKTICKLKDYSNMCLAVPLKLIEVNGSTAIGEAMGVSREIRVDFIRDP